MVPHSSVYGIFVLHYTIISPKPVWFRRGASQWMIIYALHVHRRIAITTRATAIDPGGSGARRDVTDSQQNVGVEAVVAGGDAEGQVAIPAGGIEVKPPEWLQREVVA